MGNIFRSHYINRALLSVILSCFTITYATPLPAANIGDAFAMVRLEKLVEKLAKSQKKSPDSMIEYLVDIKNEIEHTYNVSFNIDLYIDEVGKSIKKESGKYPKKELDAIKKKIKSRDKKSKNHHTHMAQVMYLEDYQLNDLDEILCLEAKHGKDKHKDDDKDEEEIIVPALLVYGVTCSVCGLFLMVLPIPVCKEWGGRVFLMGITACANSLCGKIDENKKKDDHKK